MVSSRLALLLAAAGLSAAALLLLLPAGEREAREVPWVSRIGDPSPEFLRSLEETTLVRARGTLALLARFTPEQMDNDTRYVWRNGTLKSETGSATNMLLRFALHQLGHILRVGPFIPGGEPVVSAAWSLFLNITGHHGYMPGFDVGCAGPYSLLGVLGSVLPADRPEAAKTVQGLVDLRVASGGWVNLDYSRAKQPDGQPYILSSAEITAPAVLALRRAGYPLDDPVIRGAIRALDESILRTAYRDRFPEDYIVGDGLALQAYKKNGITSLEAFRKARNELVQDILANHSDTDRLYIVAQSLLGLQGFIPEGSEPYRLGLQAILRAYDPAKHTWRANDSSIFGPAFFNTTSYNIAPLMVLQRKGYGGDYIDPVTQPPAPACAPLSVTVAGAPGGLRVRVRAPGATGASVDYTADGYRTLQSADLTPGEGGGFSGTIPGGEFQVAIKCGERYELTSWRHA